MKEGYLSQGDPKVRSHDAHGHSNPHPVHGGAFGGKKAAPFQKGNKPTVRKPEAPKQELPKAEA